jgi:hypothetical protein
MADETVVSVDAAPVEVVAEASVASVVEAAPAPVDPVVVQFRAPEAPTAHPTDPVEDWVETPEEVFDRIEAEADSEDEVLDELIAGVAGAMAALAHSAMVLRGVMVTLINVRDTEV